LSLESPVTLPNRLYPNCARFQRDPPPRRYGFVYEFFLSEVILVFPIFLPLYQTSSSFQPPPPEGKFPSRLHFPFFPFGPFLLVNPNQRTAAPSPLHLDSRVHSPPPHPVIFSFRTQTPFSSLTPFDTCHPFSRCHPPSGCVHSAFPNLAVFFSHNPQAGLPSYPPTPSSFFIKNPFFVRVCFSHLAFPTSSRLSIPPLSPLRPFFSFPPPTKESPLPRSVFPSS